MKLTNQYFPFPGGRGIKKLLVFLQAVFPPFARILPFKPPATQAKDHKRRTLLRKWQILLNASSIYACSQEHISI